ncbi:FtsW/RodA/SpoVE family cell cycle protein [Cyanobacterium aponinum]|uniref:FtsW/RodA/SpoVE family cell cycle protein n=1 Tax=Cyanobacterium aponinum TaxID=379064 RepID=UPI000C12CC08|nr:putative peptidoglycan glycosyltransferase FtsW [Cyanobacterium aponinum]MBD2393288.1 cell division protein FtsW [Cyanobacterium aponinum FACHB-4101]PHV61783.1 cell division protein FtsW [Cyanobacterium aponinum IPPAS B-1201]
MNIVPRLIPFYQPDINTWSLEARLLRWLTFLWIALGLIILFSASYAVGIEDSGNGWYYFQRQFFWAVIGLILFKIIIQIPISYILKWSGWGYVACLFMIFLTVIGLGQNINGAERWLSLGPIQIQPSELLKPFLILQGAIVFGGWKKLNWTVKGTWLGIFAFTLACILKQPNLSTTALCGMTLWLMALAGGVPYLQLMVTAMGGVLVAGLSVMVNPYQLRRITSFVDPWADARGDGYQLVQSLLAIGSGGEYGVGFGMSQQKLFYLPFQYTDFIFAVFAEEFGFIGCLLLILLLVSFTTISFLVAIRCHHPTKRLIAVGVMIILIGQSLINIGVNIGALPTTGLPFPFLSYGGSSVLSSLMLVALLIRVAIETNITEKTSV